mgnify:CR=1 FL=1
MTKPNMNYSIYLVLDPDLTASLGMVKTAIEAAKAGATVVQLRAPDWKKRQYFDCAIELKKALKPFGTRLIINDHVDVALAMDADGVHVGQKDLPVEKVRELVGPDKIVGLSINTMDEMRAVDPTIVDYVGIGPIFTTTTKKDAAAPVGLEGFQKLSLASPVPCVAIGSVKADHIPALVKAKADGIAVVSAICGQPSPYEATRELRTLWDEASKRP